MKLSEVRHTGSIQTDPKTVNTSYASLAEQIGIGRPEGRRMIFRATRNCQ